MPTFDPWRKGQPMGLPLRRGPERDLLRFLPIPEGFTVIKTATGYRETTLELGNEFPADALAVYRGGYATEVDAAEAAALTAAGYGDFIT